MPAGTLPISMQYRNIGNSGLRVSEVSLGGWLTHGRTLDTQQTQNLVHAAFDLGINFFDTADVYNQGEAELALGAALKSMRRRDVVVATKCFFPFTEGVMDRGNSRKHLFESVEDSLKRLGIERIDLMQFHRFDPTTPIEETVRAIDDLIKAGKIYYWGVSEWKAHQIVEAIYIARQFNTNPPISNQPCYNLFARGIEDSVLPVSERYGIGNVVFSPLAQGVLTGKYQPGQPIPAGTRGADEKSNMFMKNILTDEVLTKVQQVQERAKAHGFGLGEFALAWCLRQPAVSSVIIGASSVAQLEQNVKASGLEVPAELFEEAEAILA